MCDGRNVRNIKPLSVTSFRPLIPLPKICVFGSKRTDTLPVPSCQSEPLTHSFLGRKSAKERRAAAAGKIRTHAFDDGSPAGRTAAGGANRGSGHRRSRYSAASGIHRVFLAGDGPGP